MGRTLLLWVFLPQLLECTAFSRCLIKSIWSLIKEIGHVLIYQLNLMKNILSKLKWPHVIKNYENKTTKSNHEIGWTLTNLNESRIFVFSSNRLLQVQNTGQNIQGLFSNNFCTFSSSLNGLHKGALYKPKFYLLIMLFFFFPSFFPLQLQFPYNFPYHKGVVAATFSTLFCNNKRTFIDKQLAYITCSTYIAWRSCKHWIWYC